MNCKNQLRYLWVLLIYRGSQVVECLFGCWHTTYGFPVTPRLGSKPAGLPWPEEHASVFTGTYVVCLECGKEFSYDWKKMSIVPEPEKFAHRLQVEMQAQDDIRRQVNAVHEENPVRLRRRQ